MRILIAGVNYAPEQTGIGPYTTGLAEHLASQGNEVVVATTFPFAPMWQWHEHPARWRVKQSLNGVDVWRTKVVLPPRRTTAWRIIFDSSAGVGSMLTALSIPRVDVTICVSPPIQTALLPAVARHKLGKLVILGKDLPTEAARSVGMLKSRTALRAARAIEGVGYRLADHIVVITDSFGDYVRGVGVAASRISVIPDWADLESVRPMVPDQGMRLNLGARPEDFLVIYTGNMGAKQDLLNVVAAAGLLRSNKRIKLVLIGDGQERKKIADRIDAEGLDNIRILPLQPADAFCTVLTSSDALLINQAPAVVDSVMPSKLLAYMSSGQPVIAAAHPSSTTASLLRRAHCGVVVAPGNPESLASAILRLSRENHADSLKAMGLRGRRFAETHFDRRQILSRWDDLLRGIVARANAEN